MGLFDALKMMMGGNKHSVSPPPINVQPTGTPMPNSMESPQTQTAENSSYDTATISSTRTAIPSVSPQVNVNNSIDTVSGSAMTPADGTLSDTTTVSVSPDVNSLSTPATESTSTPTAVPPISTEVSSPISSQSQDTYTQAPPSATNKPV